MLSRLQFIGFIKRALLALMLLASGLTPGAVPVAAQSLTPTITLTPAAPVVAPGGTVTVNGSGFSCGQTIFISLVDSTGTVFVAGLGTVTPPCGTFTGASFTLPAAVGVGTYRVRGMDDSNNTGISAGAAGLLTVAINTVTISGIAECSNGDGGFNVLPFATVQIFSGSALVGTTAAGADGSYSFPGAATGAIYQLRYTQNTDGGIPIKCGTVATTGDGVAVAPPPFCPDQSWDTATALTSGTASSDFICKANQSIWRKISVQPGQQIALAVGNVGPHTRIALFKDLKKDLQALISSQTPLDLRQLDASMNGVAGSPWESSPWESSPWESSPWESSPWESSPWESSPWESSPWESSPFDTTNLCQGFVAAFPGDSCAGAYLTVQMQDLIAWSNNGQITKNTWDLAGDFYIRVYNNDGSFDSSQRLTLTATVLGTCGVPPEAAGTTGLKPKANSSFLLSPTSTTLTPGKRTLILTNTARLLGPNGKPLTDATNATLLTNYRNAINRFITTLNAQGGAILVDFATDTGLGADYSQWDQPPFPSCPAAANIVSSAVHDLINAYRVQSGGALRYVTILGGHTVIPYHLTPDHAALEQESGYNPGLLDVSKSAASLGSAYVMTDSYYVSFSPVNRLESEISLPDDSMAVGRLVEFPADIINVLNTFNNNGGVASPTSALVTGYTFMKDLGQFELDQLNGAGLATDSLISDTWTAPDLRNKLFGAATPGIVAVNWHARSNEAVAADYASQHPTTISSAEIAGLPAADTRFSNALVISLGCHLAYPLLDSDVIPNLNGPPQFVTDARAFTETFQNRGAMVLGNSGFGYGDTDFMGYSEELLGLVTQELTDAGPNGIPVGLALTNAKRRYLQNSGATTGVDKKSIEELTFYGPPMWTIKLPNRVARPGSNTLPVNPQNIAGTQQLSAGTVSPDYTLNGPFQLPNFGDGPSFSYFETGHAATDLSGGKQQVPYRATLPFRGVDVSAPAAGVARGVALIAADYVDRTDLSPAVSVPTTEVSGTRPPWPTLGFWPLQTFGLNSLVGQELVSTPLQWQSTSTNGLSGTTRTYANAPATRLRVYYSNLTSGAAFAGPATVSDVTLSTGTSAKSTPALHVDLTVKGSTAADVFDVLVNYTVPPAVGSVGHWKTCSLISSRVDDGTTPGGSTTTASCDNAFFLNSSSTPGSFVRHYFGDIDPAVFSTSAAPKDLLVGFQVVTGTGLVTTHNNDGQYFRLPQETATITNPKASTLINNITLPAQITYGLPATFTAQLGFLSSNHAACSLGGQTLIFNFGSQIQTATTGPDGTASATFVVLEVPNVAPPTPPNVYTLAVDFGETTACLGSSASRSPANVAKQPTSLTFGATPYVAFLRDNFGRAMRERFVYFTFSGTSNGGAAVNATRAIETDATGMAELHGMNVPAGTYNVQATYPGTISTPTGTVTLNDPLYAASSTPTVRVTADRTAPSCALTSVNYDSNGVAISITVTVQDTGSGLAAVNPTALVNGTFSVQSYVAGTQAQVIVTVTKTDLTQSTQVTLQVLDVAGNSTVCDPVMVQVGRTAATARRVRAAISPTESLATIYNGTPGLEQLQIRVNNRVLEVKDLQPGEVRSVDLSDLMSSRRPVDVVTVTAQGKPRGSAVVIFSDAAGAGP